MPQEAPERRRGSALRRVLLRAFLVQLLASYAVVGWMTYRSADQAVEALSVRLSLQLSDAVEAALRRYIDEPIEILETYAALMEAGALSPDDPDTLAAAYHGALRNNGRLGYLSYGDLEGRFVGAQRMDDGALRWRIQDSQTGGVLHTFDGQPRRPRPEPVERREGYDPVSRPWFVRAVKARGTTWTEIYPSATSVGYTLITAVRPVHRPDGAVRGVIGVDIILSQAAVFLEALTEGRPDLVFVVERGGELVATSTGEDIVSIVGKEAHRTTLSQSETPLLRAASAHVVEALGGFDGVDAPRALRVDTEAGPVLVQLVPLEGAPGLSWVIGVLVPEQPLRQHFDDLSRTTFLVSLLALGLAVLLAYSLARRISDPVLELSDKARRIQAGDLNVSFEPGADDEIGALSQSMALMVQGLRDRDRIKDAFGRYVSPELARQLAEDPESLRLGGKLTEVTLLMSDLRGFTGLSERLTPEEMVGLLNRYLGAMTEVILAHGGTIIEFIGDAIFVVFGAPFPKDGDAERAVRCALEMQRGLRTFNEEGSASGQPWLDMGVGVHSGQVVAGNIGSVRATKYGVVGEPVNLTARIESLTVAGQVLLSEATQALLPEGFELDGPMEVRLKGVSAVAHLYALTAVTLPERRALPSRHLAPRSPLDRPAQLYLIDGRQVLRAPTPAQLLELGVDDAVLLTQTELLRLSKIALRVEIAEGIQTGDIYAVVSEQEATVEGGWRVRLTFTSVEPVDTQRIHRATAPE